MPTESACRSWRSKIKKETKLRVNRVLEILREIRGGAYTLERAVMTAQFLPQVRPLRVTEAG